MKALKIGILTLLVALLVMPLQAQDTTPDEHFAAVFPKPTGTNGYEDLMTAGVVLSRTEKVQVLCDDTESTLEDIRQLMQTPEAQKATSLFYQGMAKPILSPRNPQTVGLDTVFLEFIYFRRYARLHAKDIRLKLADGNTAEAIKALKAGLKFGQQVQKDGLISGQAGLAITGIILKGFVGTLPTLSAKDCDAVMAIANEWLQDKSPMAEVLAAEQNWLTRITQQLQEKPAKLANFLRDLGVANDTIRIYQSPDVDIKMLLMQANRVAVNYFQDTLEGVKTPYFQRKPIQEVSNESISGLLAHLLSPFIDHVADSYEKVRARVQTLGVRCALRRYYREHNKFPMSLAELKLGSIGIDPFSGKPFEYQREGTRYTITIHEPTYKQ